jgi:hypothetical protein
VVYIPVSVPHFSFSQSKKPVRSYICRADIRDSGYKHFCQHFRQTPGTPCNDCELCDLYANEDEAAAIRRAAKSAEEEYWQRHNKPKGWSWERVKGPVASEVLHGRVINRGLGEWVDMVLEWLLDMLLEF